MDEPNPLGQLPQLFWAFLIPILLLEGGSFYPVDANSVEQEGPSPQDLYYNQVLLAQQERQQRQLEEEEIQRERMAQQVMNAIKLRRQLEAQEEAQAAAMQEQEQLYSGDGNDYFVSAGRQQPQGYSNDDPLPQLNPDLKQLETEAVAQQNLEKLGNDLSKVVQSQESEETREKSTSKSKEKANTKEQSPSVPETHTPPKKPAKKGQYEFVEFVEPRPSEKLRGIESLDKRVATEYGDGRGSRFNLFLNGGNFFFMAMIAMGSVMLAMMVTGGMYYYNRVRSARDDPFDEFMRYSPTGPGRDKMKKTHLPPSRLSPTGDEALAYKAQLYHYRQTKQKIQQQIAPVPHPDQMSPGSDDEDENDDQNNFSIYECPGLASTGDIEVQNPNFVGGAKSPSPVPSQGSGRGE